MIVTNRKLFKKRPARDRLNQAAGIMASSPELMGEVQGFEPGGYVNPISKAIDAIDFELPQITVSGRRGPNELARLRSLNEGVVISEVPVKLPSGEFGYAVYDNGQLKGYQSEPPGTPMINRSREREIDKISQEVRKEIDPSSVPRTDFSTKDLDPKLKFVNELRKRAAETDTSTDFGEDVATRREDAANLIEKYPFLQYLIPSELVKKGIGAVYDYFTALSPSERARLQEQYDSKDASLPINKDIAGIASDTGRLVDEFGTERMEVFEPGVAKSVGATTEQIFDLISQGTGPKGDPETVEQILKQMEIDRATTKKNLERIQKGKEDTERMKGPVAPTTSLSSRVEKVKAERDAIEAKEQQDFERAVFAGQSREKFFDPLSVEKFLEQRPIATEIGGEDPRVNLPPGAFPKADKQVEELNNIVSGNKKYDGDDKTFDAMGEPNIEAKRAIVNQTNNIVQTTTGSNLDQLMKEFIGKAPEYEGISPGLARMKIGFAIAAGKSADGIQNIANGLSLGADILIKDKSEKDAFNRQVRLSALQYGLGEISKERAENRLINRENRKQNYFVADKDIVHPETGEKIEEGGLVALTTGYINKNGLPSNVTTTELAKAAIDTKIAIEKLIQKQKKENILDVDKAVILQEKVNESVINFTSANTLKELVEGNTIRNAEGSITGIQPAFLDLVNKVAVAAGIELDQKYENVAKYNSDMRRVSNLLLKDLLGEGSKNVSNIDRELADEIVGLYRTYITTDPDILNDKLQNILGTLEQKEQGALTILNSSLEGIAGKTTASGKPIDLGIPQEIISRIEGNTVVPSTTWGMKDGIYRKLK